MIFNRVNYPEIKKACLNKKEIIFEAPKELTGFSVDSAPREWKAISPTYQPPEGYAQIFLYAGNDARGALMTLELLVHLDGGQIFYKAIDDDKVALKITWPKAKTI